jgi:thiol-disulfide isomerase/thioredoxin
MNDTVSLVAAFGGGLISFLSPCVLPIVPAYLAIITGLEVGELNDGGGHQRRSVLLALDRLVWATTQLQTALVAVLAIGSTSSDDPGSTEPEAFDLPALEGDGRMRLADLAGHPVVVNFVASWCTACDAELPGFSVISRELEGEVTFVGVNARETGDPLVMPERHDITWWPLARDTGGRQGSGLHEALGGRGMPITAFCDADGNLLHVDGGALPEPALRDRIQQLYGIAAQGAEGA